MRTSLRNGVMRAILLIAFSLVLSPALAQNRNLFVSNLFDNTIRRYSSTGQDMGLFASTGLSQPYALAFDRNDNLYVANSYGVSTPYDYSIRRFSPAGTDLGNFVTTGLNHPEGLAFDLSGNLYVANANSTIRKYSPTGTDLGQFAGPSVLADPTGWPSTGAATCMWRTLLSTWYAGSLPREWIWVSSRPRDWSPRSAWPST